MAINLFKLTRNNNLQARVTGFIQGTTLRDVATLDVDERIKECRKGLTTAITLSMDTTPFEEKGAELKAEKEAILAKEYQFTLTDADKTLRKAWGKAPTDSYKEEALVAWFAAHGCTVTTTDVTSYVRALTGTGATNSKACHAKGQFSKEKGLNVKALVSILADQYLNSGLIKKDVIAPELVRYFEALEEAKKAEKEAKKAARKAAKNNK